MANANIASGMHPVRMLDGSPFNGSGDMFYVPSSDGTALYIGDPVKLAGSADAGGIASIAAAAAGNALLGSVIGFADATSMSAGYRAASTTAYVLVAHGQDILYEIQEDADGGALAAADIGLNANIIVAAGSAYTKRSGTMLDTSSKNTTATLQLRIRGLVQRPDNALSANAKVLVSLNNTTESPGTGADGV
jgi:hypothetical protein